MASSQPAVTNVRRRLRVLIVGLLSLLLTAGMFVMAIWLELPSAQSLRERITAQPYATWVFDRHGHPMGALFANDFEPGPYVHLTQVPPQVLADLVWFEDRRFHTRRLGVDLRSLFRAAVTGVGGGSTVEMQVCRMVLQFPERTLFRKLVESVCAIKMSLAFGKDELLESYVNRAPFGQLAHPGLSSAANGLFGKPPWRLTREEGIVLTSLLSLPSLSRKANREDRLRVYRQRLERMLRSRRITDTEYRQMLTMPEFRFPADSGTSYGVFLDRVAGELGPILARDGVSSRAGISVVTTLDAERNDAVARALTTAMRPWTRAQASFLALDHDNGVLIYVVRGTSHRGDLDLLASSRTMGASRLKVPVYSLLIDTRLKEGWSAEAIVNMRLPTKFVVSRGLTVGSGAGTVTLRDAVSRSLDGPAYHAVDMLSPSAVADFLRRMDIEVPAVASLAMGSVGVSDLSLAAAYSTLLVRNGYYRQPSFVRSVTNRFGRAINADSTGSVEAEVPVSSDEAGRILKQLLREAVYREKGTSAAMFRLCPDLQDFDVAAKTGTSDTRASPYQYRGVTGVVGTTTWSLTLQGKGMGLAAATAVPVAAQVLGSCIGAGPPGHVGGQGRKGQRSGASTERAP